MANKSVIFPETKLASAQAYLAACNIEWISYLDSQESNVDHSHEIFSEIRLDYQDQHVVGLYGPPFSWDGINVIPEPAHLALLRADGVVHDYPIWPDEF